ncbi:MAG: hypothetical protein SH868_04645 [Bythopirellula sp.]|nr:hypothetical protein [Bythopirellula sp.]
MKPILIKVVFLALGFTSSVSAWALPALMFRTVALSGQEAPGTGGAVYQFIATPQIDAQGGTMFTALLALTGGVTSGDNTGLWSEGSGSLSLVARKGSQAPGAPSGALFDFFPPKIPIPTLAASGITVFGNALQLSGGDVTSFNQSGVWVERLSGLELLAREGDQAPDTPAGALFSFFNEDLINAAGQVALHGSLFIGAGGVTDENNNGIWAEANGNLTLKVRESDLAPGTTSDTRFRSLISNSLRFNSAGQIAFSSLLTGPEVNPANNFGVWSEGPGALSLIARRGDQAPGTALGSNFDLSTSSTTRPEFNAAGTTAFRTNLMLSASAGVDANNNEGIWSDATGSLSLVVREGDSAPGTSGASEFSFFLNFELSDAGSIVFTALTRPFAGSGGGYGIWSDLGGELSLIAKEGDPAPGTPLGTMLALSRPFPIVNPLGSVAFVSQLTGMGVNSGNISGLWAQDQAGNLRLVVRSGDLFEVAPGDLRTISSISVLIGSGGSDGLPRSFNADYKLAFRLGFTDGSQGIFTAMLTVPEPSAMLLAALCAATCLAGWQRRPGFARSKLRG